MPDNQDYEALERLLASPETWSEDDAEMMEFLLKNQRKVAASVHPLDKRGKSRLWGLVDRIESALTRYRESAS